MSPQEVSKPSTNTVLLLSESGQEFNIPTVDESRAIAKGAFPVHESLLSAAAVLLNLAYPTVSKRFQDYHRTFLQNVKNTDGVSLLGSQYFSGFKERVSDKCRYEDDSWEANKVYISDFLKDERGEKLIKDAYDVSRVFDKLHYNMENEKSGHDIPDIVKATVFNTVLGVFGYTAKASGLGNAWNEFYHEIDLIRGKMEIAIDSPTKRGLIDRVKKLGDASKVLSQAMEAYAQSLKDSGILDVRS